MALKAAKHEAITIDDFKDNEEFIQFMLEQPELRGVVVSHASHWLTIRKQWKAQGFSVVNGQSDSLKPLRTAGAAKAWLREYHTKEDHMMFVFPAEILQGVTSRWKESDAKHRSKRSKSRFKSTILTELMLTKFLMTHRDEEADAMTRNRCQISNISLMLTAPFYSSLFRKKVDQ